MKHRKTLTAAFFASTLVLGCQVAAHAQTTTILDASYGPNGNGAALTTGTFNLDTFTVTAVYTAGSATNESVFITDGTANARLFGSQTALASLTVGTQATATVTASVFQGTEELKTPANVTVVSAGNGNASTPANGGLSQVASTVTTANTPNQFTAGPGDGTNLYASEGALLFAPVSFTITPTTSGTLSTTGTTTLTDTATGDVVNIYRAAASLAFTAGVQETITGLEQPYNGFAGQNSLVESEIVNVTSVTNAVPEPTTFATCLLALVSSAFIFLRRRRA